MKKGYSEQHIRPAGGRRAPRSSELKSRAADKLLRILQGKPHNKSRNNSKALAFARLDGESKVKFLKKKLYRLYEQQLKACEDEMETDLVDREIDKLENQIQEIQIEMWE